MVLENNDYPRDSRVRKEAETLASVGWDVEVLAPRVDGQPRHEVCNGVRVRRFRLRDGKGTMRGTAAEYLHALFAVTALVLVRVALRRPGIVHVHNPPDFFFPLMWIARLRGWRAVFDHHDDAAGMLRSMIGRESRVGSALRWLAQRSAATADLTVTTNETQADALRPYAKRLVTVKNAPPDFFAGNRPRAPRTQDRARLVFLGEIGVQDRVERTVEILEALGTVHGIDAELLIIGDGPCRERVEARAAALGVADRVTITGFVPYEAVPGFLASAHVGLDTSEPTPVNHGSTMIKIVEYLVVGLPVVATPLRESIVTGGNALTVAAGDDVADFAEPVADLLRAPDAWVAAAELAHRRGIQLRWATQGSILVNAYDDLVTS
jgi:glycosyltransferase involved in cell wall biosynthesis